MSKRTTIVIAAALFVGGFGAYTLVLKDPYADLQVSSGDASFEKFRSIEDLETSSELVVIGKFTGHREMYERKDEEGRVIVTLSQSTLEIERVIKGNAQPKEMIAVFEEGYLIGDRYITAEHYKWMNKDGRYLLFLYSQPINDTYVINGIYQGKYDLNIKKKAVEYADPKQAFVDPKVEYMGRDFELEEFYQMKDQALKKYELK